VVSWVAPLAAILGAVIAFSGVYFTARAADRRERNNRLWDKRAELYVEALLFLYDIRDSGAPPVSRHEPDPNDYWRRYTELSAKLAVFSDRALLEVFEAAAKPTTWEPVNAAYPQSVWGYGALIPFEDGVHERITGKPLEPTSGPAAVQAPVGRSRRLRAELLDRVVRRRKGGDDHVDEAGYSGVAGSHPYSGEEGSTYYTGEITPNPYYTPPSESTAKRQRARKKDLASEP